MNWTMVFVVFFISIAAFLTAKTGKLTIAGSVTGWILALLIYIGAGYVGLLLLAAFFTCGTLATAWGVKDKEARRLTVKGEGERTAGQVLANGGVAALLSVMMLLFPQHKALLMVMMAGSFSAATADTISSELGMLYGKQMYHVLTWKSGRRGDNGVVSLEGCLLGIAFSIIPASIYCLYIGWGSHFFWILLAGTIGNLADSILGATLEQKGYLSNNGVNFLNTFIGGLAVLVFPN